MNICYMVSNNFPNFGNFNLLVPIFIVVGSGPDRAETVILNKRHIVRQIYIIK
ncbi:hypothetical protein SAMN05443550_11451 [Pedobacter hartonius]|uniref:Uncharacterized protein n=1 Tax=Pedobacter hartonius TaxID=425514 RepID=A0A1H4H867_9SPHI|nr:hypothetical protein SAMN05443550_11451 [Pedobacter hartonius]